MRPALKGFAAWFAFVVVATLIAAPYSHGVFAFNQGGPNLNTLEGQPTCAGPPTAPHRLVFNNGSWCDDSTSSLWNSFIPTIANGVSGQQSRMGNLVPPNVYRLTGYCSTAPVGCTTSPVVAVRCNAVAAATITLTNAAISYDSGAVTAACSVQIDLTIATAAVGCTTAAANCNFSVAY